MLELSVSVLVRSLAVLGWMFIAYCLVECVVVAAAGGTGFVHRNRAGFCALPASWLSAKIQDEPDDDEAYTDDQQQSKDNDHCRDYLRCIRNIVGTAALC